MERDFKKGLKWYRKAADQGDAKAQANLGMSYASGMGAEQDYKEANEWFRKAANQGDANAQFRLGVANAKGLGAEKDFKKAMKWSQDAAVQGHAEAQYLIGAIYETGGKGTMPKDHVTAYAWYDLASKNGNHPANIRMITLSVEMPLKQINKAEALAKEMIKKNPKLVK